MSESGILGLYALLNIKNSRSALGDINVNASDNGKQNVTLNAFTFESMHSFAAKEYRTQFFYDLLMMRVGVQSKRFGCSTCDQIKSNSFDVSNIFVYYPQELDSLVLGLSDTLICKFLQSHLICGTYYRKLVWFFQYVVAIYPNPLGTIYHGRWFGQIWACFAKAINYWLVNYQSRMHSLIDSFQSDGSFGLIFLNNKLQLLTKEIQ